MFRLDAGYILHCKKIWCLLFHMLCSNYIFQWLHDENYYLPLHIHTITSLDDVDHFNTHRRARRGEKKEKKKHRKLYFSFLRGINWISEHLWFSPSSLLLSIHRSLDCTEKKNMKAYSFLACVDTSFCEVLFCWWK